MRRRAILRHVDNADALTASRTKNVAHKCNMECLIGYDFMPANPAIYLVLVVSTTVIQTAPVHVLATIVDCTFKTILLYFYLI